MRIKSNYSRYDVQQGFDQLQNNAEVYIQEEKKGNETPLDLLYQKKKKSSSSSRKEQTKLRYISIERQKSHFSHYQYLKEQQQKKIHKSMTLDKQEKLCLNSKKRSKISKYLSKQMQIEKTQSALIKQNRLQIGENIQIKQYNSEEVKQLKQNLINQGASLVFQNNKQSNSHGLFKKFLKQKNPHNFLRSKYNQSLLQRINQSYINPKSQISVKINQLNSKKNIQFKSEFQSSNLDFVTQINPYQYNLYIKADTNTLGHQNWFYFKLINNSQQTKNIFMNICNLKRNFKMVKKGQKLFYRYRKINQPEIKTSIQNQEDEWSDWQKIKDQVTVTRNQQIMQSQIKNKNSKLFKLSFSSSLQPLSQYQFSLLPPFTYSMMLQELDKIQQKSNHVHIQTLTYSLLGLAIPILTFTKNNIKNDKKKVILISSRIHPGQTCGSFVLSGILNNLCQQSQQINQLLQKFIIKIVPMINPDGVILGNFRTNYLGNDLNRSFHKDNDSIFPQIVAIKQLGKQLKEQFKDRFFVFLDLHGHSSQKNIFTYGPNYDQNHKSYVDSRFFPKTLDYLSDQFDYNKCTFNLQQCKTSTARGHFLSALKVMSFTIQSSYALYDSKLHQSKNHDISIQNWYNFGKTIICSLGIWVKSFSTKLKVQKDSKQIKNQSQIVNPQKETDQQLIVMKLKKLIKKQMIMSKKLIKQRKQSQSDQQSQNEDSDGENQQEDIPIKQRDKLQQKFIQGNMMHLFPRILRPAIIHPQVNPPLPLFSVSKIGSVGGKGSSISIANGRIKRSRYTNMKPVNVNSAYTQYLIKEVKGLQYLRPNVNLMKLEKKEMGLRNGSKVGEGGDLGSSCNVKEMGNVLQSSSNIRKLGSTSLK